jgi:hypothetical protein
VLAACCAGDVSLLRRLIHEHVECDAGVRRHTLRDDVSVCRVLDVACCGRGTGLRVGMCCDQEAGRRCCGYVAAVASMLRGGS